MPSKSGRRRGHGEGSIFQRSGGRWVALLDLGWQDGKRRRKSLYGRTQAEVQQRLTEARRLYAGGSPMPDARRKLGEYLSSWLEAVRHDLRPGTHERYRQLLQLHVIPTIGHTPLTKLSVEQVQTLRGRKLDEGLAPSTVGQILRVLHKAMQDAFAAGKVTRNVCDLVKAPRSDAPEGQTFTGPQAQRFIAEIAEHPLRPLYILAIASGLRQGELLSLRWRDVDLDAGALTVRRTGRRITGRGIIENAPKTARGERGLVLPLIATEALREHRAHQLEYRVGAAYWEDNDLVFANEIGRRIEPGNLRRRSFYPLLETAKLPRIRFHDLRHSAGSLLAALGVPPKVVQEILGHASVTTTLRIYTHTMPGMQEEAARKMDQLLRPPSV